jgi:iron complex transport system substrate-binding protein
MRLICFSFCLLFFVACQNGIKESSRSQEDGNYKTVTDMRGEKVEIPIDPKRVISVSDGMIESVMAHFGMLDKLIALGSSCLQQNFTYDIPGKSQTYTYADGMNPLRVLFPEIAELPLIARSGMPLQLEQIIALEPDLVILREGCCTINSLDEPKNRQALSLLESFGVPVVVLKGTTVFDPPSLEKFNQEILLLGEIFGHREKAAELVAYLDKTIEMIKERTRSISDSGKPRVLMLGLSPVAREGGSAGVTRGTDTIEGYFVEQIVHAKNAIQGRGGRAASMMLSDEQILALDPDKVVLHTASGYHPPEEIYEAPYYSKLQNLRAVREKNVISLPWTPCNCSKRLEYPIEVMMIAKQAYPDLFSDISIHEWVLDFYGTVYGVDREKAKEIRSAQWLDWTIDQF